MVSAGEMPAVTAAELFADSFVDVVGSAARSVILHGSLSTGGFRPGRSDIDVLAVIDGGLTEAHMTALERLIRQAEVGSAAGLDLHVVTAEVAGAPTREPALELFIGRYDRASIEFEVERRVAAAADLPTELSMARADGRALRGAAPRDLLAPVPADWIVDRGRYWLRTWRTLTDDAENAAFMALTACRIWRFAIENVHCSKPQAAQWALDRNPSLTAVRQAAKQYQHDSTGPNGESDPIDESDLADLIDRVLRETARSQ